MENTVSEMVKNGDQIDLPPGFRFHPTDEELISHYLHKKVMDINFSCGVMADVDLNKSEPWDLPWKAKMGEKEWYFFCLRDRKYPTGLRTNRATESGYWKATGKDKEIHKGKYLVGMKKTLVFYGGRAPKGEKSNWIMHEYRLDGKFSAINLPKTAKNEWVICRVFQKNYGAKKIHYSGLVNPGSLGNDLDSSVLPPLSDFSPFNSEIKPVTQNPPVSCFSNPNNNFNNPLISENFPRIPNLNAFYSSQTAPMTSNSRFQGSVLMQGQSFLKALIENPGSNMEKKKMFQTEREGFSVSQETGLTCDMNNDISSVMSDFEMGRRTFDDKEASTSGGPVDLDGFWNY